jgi:hypothetical protein
MSDELHPNYMRPHKPCAECPFKCDSTRNYFGPYSREYYYRAAQGEGVVQCHMTSKLPDDKHRHCTGVVLFRKNILKEPRGEEQQNHQDACVGKYGVKGILNLRTFFTHHDGESFLDDDED